MAETTEKTEYVVYASGKVTYRANDIRSVMAHAREKAKAGHRAIVTKEHTVITHVQTLQPEPPK